MTTQIYGYAGVESDDESDSDNSSDESNLFDLLSKSKNRSSNSKVIDSSGKSTSVDGLQDKSEPKSTLVEATVSVLNKQAKIQGELTKRGTILISCRHSRFVFDKWLEDVESVRLITRLRNARRMPLDAASFRRVKDLHAKARAEATTLVNTSSKT